MNQLFLFLFSFSALIFCAPTPPAFPDQIQIAGTQCQYSNFDAEPKCWFITGRNDYSIGTDGFAKVEKSGLDPEGKNDDDWSIDYVDFTKKIVYVQTSTGCKGYPSTVIGGRNPLKNAVFLEVTTYGGRLANKFILPTISTSVYNTTAIYLFDSFTNEFLFSNSTTYIPVNGEVLIDAISVSYFGAGANPPSDFVVPSQCTSSRIEKQFHLQHKKN